MWVLFALGIILLIVFAERALYLHRGQIRSTAFVSGIKNILAKRRLVEALTVCVTEHGHEFTGRVEDVGELLADPPGVFAAGPVIVIATAHPIERSGIQDVAVLIQDRAVVTAIHGDLAMAVKLPAHDLESGSELNL